MPPPRNPDRHPDDTQLLYALHRLKLCGCHGEVKERFTATALPLKEAMRTWPDLPAGWCLAPVNEATHYKALRSLPTTPATTPTTFRGILAAHGVELDDTETEEVFS